MVDERKHKHLEFVQGVINRLSMNSFFLKGWSVILISALFALSDADSRTAFVSIAIIPAVMFWGLDGFFLWQEQLYRKLYDHVRQLGDKDIDFSMDTTSFKTTDGPKWARAIFSKTLIPFHGVLIISVIVVIVVTLKTTGG